MRCETCLVREEEALRTALAAARLPDLPPGEVRGPGAAAAARALAAQRRREERDRARERYAQEWEALRAFRWLDTTARTHAAWPEYLERSRRHGLRGAKMASERAAARALFPGHRDARLCQDPELVHAVLAVLRDLARAAPDGAVRPRDLRDAMAARADLKAARPGRGAGWPTPRAVAYHVTTLQTLGLAERVRRGRGHCRGHEYFFRVTPTAAGIRTEYDLHRHARRHAAATAPAPVPRAAGA